VPPSIACITKPDPFEVITKPEELGRVNPVPPLVVATAVPSHVPEVIVPTVTKLANESIADSRVVSVVPSILSMFVRVKVPELSLNG
jgi:hypothetical protein